MTDEYIVVVTNDENLVKSIQNATKMEVIHVTNHDSAKEKNYRRKIVIIDPDTVWTTRKDFSTWSKKSHYLVILLTVSADDFINQNAELFSDVWYKPVNPVLLGKRISQIGISLQKQRYIRESASFFVAETRNALASVKGYADMMLTKDKLVGELTEQQLNFVATIRSNGVRVQRLLEDMKISASIEANTLEFSLTKVSFRDILKNLKAPEIDARLSRITPYPSYTVDLPQSLPSLFADEWWLLFVFERALLNAQSSPNSIILSVTLDNQFFHFRITDFGEYSYSLDRDNSEKFFFQHYYSSTKVIEHIIKEHGGKMWLEQDDDSSTFHFTIPIAKNSEE